MPIEDMKEALKEQMREEITVLNQLDHPYIGKYEEAFEDDRYIYIVMNVIKGHELLKDVGDDENFGKYPEEWACSLMFKILNAMHHIHSVGIIHRDLKPENIMVDENGDPIIIDFGLSKDCKGL